LNISLLPQAKKMHCKMFENRVLRRIPEAWARGSKRRPDNCTRNFVICTGRRTPQGEQGSDDGNGETCGILFATRRGKRAVEIPEHRLDFNGWILNRIQFVDWIQLTHYWDGILWRLVKTGRGASCQKRLRTFLYNLWLTMDVWCALFTISLDLFAASSLHYADLHRRKF
jgi:hypothetical protein